MKKVAFCFLISNESGVLNKEEIWKNWIEPNKDIINVYFHYKNYEDIKSSWIKENVIHKGFITKTDYFHVVPAYISLLQYSIPDDSENQWFCFVTDSCVPIISPLKFRNLFLANNNYSLFKWRKSWWNVRNVKRANLCLLEEEFHLAHDPWFILKKEDALLCIGYKNTNKSRYQTICNGIVANESIFAIILKTFNQLDNVKSVSTHLTDWSRMASPTSPHLFKEGNKKDCQIIDSLFLKNEYAMFLRKVAPEFPDSILHDYIYRDETLSPIKRRWSI